jgi:hypothetical protein
MNRSGKWADNYDAGYGNLFSENESLMKILSDFRYAA